jgi:hypothetical protein
MRTVVLTLSLAMALNAVPPIAWAAGQAQKAAIEGAAHDSSGKPLKDKPVQTRDVKTGQVAGSAQTDAFGRFRFGDLAPATYVVELLNDQKKVVGTSIEIPLTNVPAAFVTVCTPSEKVPPVTPVVWKGATPYILGAAAALGITAAVVSTRSEASPVR